MRKSGVADGKESAHLVDNLDHQYVKYDAFSNTHKIVCSGFPITTNQDFHDEAPFLKQRVQKGSLNKRKPYNKKHSSYTAYVNAMFNSGVYRNPV